MSFFFFFNDTATTEIYTLSLTRRSSDLRGSGPHRHPQPLPNTRQRRPDLCATRRAGAARPPTVQVARCARGRSEEHTSELQSQSNLVCRLLLEKKKKPYHRSCCDSSRTH